MTILVAKEKKTSPIGDCIGRNFEPWNKIKHLVVPAHWLTVKILQIPVNEVF